MLNAVTSGLTAVVGFCIANPLPAALLVVQAVIFNRVARTIAATFSGRRRRR